MCGGIGGGTVSCKEMRGFFASLRMTVVAVWTGFIPSFAVRLRRMGHPVFRGCLEERLKQIPSLRCGMTSSKGVGEGAGILQNPHLARKPPDMGHPFCGNIWFLWTHFYPLLGGLELQSGSVGVGGDGGGDLEGQLQSVAACLSGDDRLGAVAYRFEEGGDLQT